LNQLATSPPTATLTDPLPPAQAARTIRSIFLRPVTLDLVIIFGDPATYVGRIPATGEVMTRSLAACLVIAAFSLGSPPPARAAIGDTTTYDTVDAIEAVGAQIKVTGIVAGQDVPTTKLYSVVNSSPTANGLGSTDVAASRCDRFALLAAAKPGKFQFAMVESQTNRFSCKLIVRTP
jgi:hypothetical protein